MTMPGNGSWAEVREWIGAEVGYGESPRGSNKTKYAAMAMQPTGYAWCLPGRTLISTDKGMVAASDIAVGDRVWTKEQRFRPVVKVLTRERETFRINAQGSLLEVTADHPLWVKRNKDAAPEWLPAGDVVRGMYLSHTVDHGGGTINVPADLALVAGMYVADGHADKRPGRKSVSISDANHEGDRIEKALMAAGLEFRRYERRTNVQFDINAGSWFHQFGTDSKSKTVGQALLWPREAREAFLEGYALGDGHLTKTCGSARAGTSLSCQTVSQALAVGIAAVARSLGHHPSIRRYARPAESVIEGRTVTCQPWAFTVRWTVEAPLKPQCHTQGGLLWTLVKSIDGHATQKVYDFTVHEDHSFIADGVVVHNCATFVSAALRENGVPVPRKVLTASSRTMYAEAKAAGLAVPIKNVLPGDVLHMTRGQHRLWLGHVGFCIAVKPGGVLVSIEGNTNGAGSATGGSVLIHTRQASVWNLGAWRPRYAPAVPVKTLWSVKGDIARAVSASTAVRISTIEEVQRLMADGWKFAPAPSTVTLV